MTGMDRVAVVGAWAVVAAVGSVAVVVVCGWVTTRDELV
jgi:hypothetical protein